jgi:chromosome segregation ATPase
MDQELIAYLDAKFEGIDRRFEDMQGRIDQRFEDMQGRIDQRFEDMQGQIDQRFDKTAGQIGEAQKQIGEAQKQIGEAQKQIGEAQKQIGDTTVLVEQLRSDIQAVAEGHEMLSKKIDRIYVELRTERQHDRDEHRAALKRVNEPLAD